MKRKLKKQKTSLFTKIKRWVWFTLFYIALIISLFLILGVKGRKLEQVSASDITPLESTIIQPQVDILVEEPVVIEISDEPTRENILNYYKYLGESEEDIAIWSHIIEVESKWDANSQAPTKVYQCSDGRFIELKLYEDGVYWQDYCENYGTYSINEMQSGGLLHILPTTAEGHGCNIVDWKSEIQCGIAIKNQSGFTQWASYFSY